MILFHDISVFFGLRLLSACIVHTALLVLFTVSSYFFRCVKSVKPSVFFDPSPSTAPESATAERALALLRDTHGPHMESQVTTTALGSEPQHET